ncbi:flagellar motor switch protein FliN/FliY [Singulisphaera sp. GP187]|uniref:FliM/FliN family flagellar motor switch protein n=1 Tax=Singulisphaera sp. GP187 TaxID=1882752 RepID=UPI00092619FA|nr:FliM/FliN family flagellar motor switch protein [Singulisphaera sp. GP187]SIN84915.1 flagellar motor switch protein FliN/FliY [Singulisphaera sp. GP187]
MASASDHDEAEVRRPMVESGPLGRLPLLSHRQVHLEYRLGRITPDGRLPTTSPGLVELFGPVRSSSRAEVLWRASGLGRPGLVAQFSWPRLSTRLAIGIETPIAHALVDRLLGDDRPPTEGRLQLTPVEWGVLTFLIARGLSNAADQSGPLGPWDLLMDRAGPDPFDVRQLGTIVTLRWGIRVGDVDGSVRLWLPESLVALWLATEPTPSTEPGPAESRRFRELSSLWRAEAGTISLPRGVGTLRVGGVLPLLGGSRLRGTPQSPSGPVELTARLSGTHHRLWFSSEPVAGSGGLLLNLKSGVRSNPVFREGLALSHPASTDPNAGSSQGPGAVSPTDIPITLTVELGRVNFTLSRLADLKPGDVVELGRHSREPVELTSGGRLVARGELVLIDTELGVRVTNIFL